MPSSIPAWWSSFSYLFSGDCFVTCVQFHLLEWLVNIMPSENVKPFLFLFSKIHLFLEIYLWLQPLGSFSQHPCTGAMRSSWWSGVSWEPTVACSGAADFGRMNPGSATPLCHPSEAAPPVQHSHWVRTLTQPLLFKQAKHNIWIPLLCYYLAAVFI